MSVTLASNIDRLSLSARMYRLNFSAFFIVARKLVIASSSDRSVIWERISETVLSIESCTA